MYLVTLADLVDDLSAYTGKGVAGEAVAAVRGSAMGAIRELATHMDWNYYRTRYRFLTDAPQTGSITFVFSTRVATLAAGTWPSWSADGRLLVGIFEYQIEAVLSPTTVRLAAAACPPADLTDPTGYQIVHDLYPLPDDFSVIERAAVADGGGRMAYRQFGTLSQIPLSVGRPAEFGTEPVRSPPGRLGIRLWPSPGSVYPIEVLYRRRPREPLLVKLNPGPVRVASDGLSLTADKGVFTARHVGAVVRLGGDTAAPTGTGGVNPAADERIATAATSTTLGWVGAVTVPDTKVGCVVSDLVDIEPGAMTTALYHMGRRYLRHATRSKTVGDETGMEQRALAAARDADSRYSGPRYVGDAPVAQRLATMPIVADTV